jgi:DNA-binding NtrC family response regulator
MLAETPERIDWSAGDVKEDVGNFSLRQGKFARVRVLVVEDEPLIRWSCSETLGDSGFQVIEVDNGAAALFALTSPQAGADVVLLDLMLPDFCDLALLAVMRRVAPDVPIVVMTAFATPEIVDRARRIGAFAVITKPFEIGELAPLLRRAVQAAPLD